MTDETAAALEAGDGEHEHSYGEYQRRKKHGLPDCDGCGAATRAYVREWRRQNPHRGRGGRVRAPARNRGLMRLAGRYPDEYQALLVEEQARRR